MTVEKDLIFSNNFISDFSMFLCQIVRFFIIEFQV